MNGVAEWLSARGPGLADHLWQTTAVVVMVWVAMLGLRRTAAGVRYGLWLAASVKFLLPFSVLIALGGMLPRPQRAVAPAVYSAVEMAGQPFSVVEAGAGASGVVVVSARERLVQALPIVLGALWMCGFAVVAVMWAVRWRRAAGRRRGASEARDGREMDALREVERRMGWGARPVPLLVSDEVMEPGVFGVWRPALVWPAGLTERLEQDQLEAILAHELAHVRRRDNLAALVHMAVEALFWFHPAVWWMERRLVEERERACDEAVVALGSRPGVYAEGLVRACRFCVESRVMCVAGISGADLGKRVREVMTMRMERLGRVGRCVLTLFALTAVAGPVAFGILRMVPNFSQLLLPSGKTPSFAVASVRPSSPDEVAGGSVRADRYLAKARTLREIIEYAYGMGYGAELSGGPSWVATDRFTIDARPDDADAQELTRMTPDDRDQQIRIRVQSLLAKAFGLTVSVRMKELPVYELVVTKGGLKCPKDDSAPAAISNLSRPRFRWYESPAPPPPPAGWTPPTPEQAKVLRQSMHMRTQGWPFWLVVTVIGHEPELEGRPLIDKTALDGQYDCELKWSQIGSDGTGPSFFTALREQMGLKLVPAKDNVETLVIDHVEKPASPDYAGGEASAAPQALPPNGTVSASSAAKSAPVQNPAPEAAVTDSGKKDQPASAPATEPVLPMAKDADPAFEVAAIRPTNPDDTNQGFHLRGHRVSIENETVESMITFAFGVHPRQIVDAPAWVGSERYDVDGVPNADGQPDLKQYQRIVQKVLADRFGMKFHREQRELPVYAMQVAKGGPKLPPSADPTALEDQTGRGHGSWQMMKFTNNSMDDLTLGMQYFVGRPVVNQTGLTGRYDFVLRWTPDEAHATDSNAPPGIFTAFEEQLGLKLDAVKAPVNVLVIDRVQRPSAN